MAAFVHQKESVKPRPFASPEQIELGKALGLAVGQPIEVRYKDDWFHADVRGFTAMGTIALEWLGGGEAEIPAVDVRPSKRRPTTQVPRAAPTFGQLVIIGDVRPRTGAKLQAMAAVDRKVSGHFAERFPPKPSGSLFGFDIDVVALPAVDGGACVRQRSKISSASEALVEVLGRHAFIAGDGSERTRVRALLTGMVPQAGPFGDAAQIPDELKECSSMLRVPTMAVSNVAGTERATLSRIEDVSGCLTFWMPLGTTARARRRHSGATSANGTVLGIGTKVHARYQGDWHSAVILGTGQGKQVRISWDYDGSESLVPATDIKSSLPVPSLLKREQWLRLPRILAIVGPERARRACTLQVMAATELSCPGVWTDCPEEAVSEIHDGAAEDEVFYGAAAVMHEASAQELGG